MNEINLSEHVNNQIYNFFNLKVDVSPFIEVSLDRTLKCFQKNQNKYYQDLDNISIFHSGQYSIFLYYLSNTIYKSDVADNLADLIYYLNKVLHSVDWFYAIELPVYWGVEHPLGSVLGRAEYQNGLFIYQGCTVGGNKAKYPTLGENVIMYSNSSILGDSTIGNNVLISTGTTIIDEDVPEKSIVFGQSPNLVIKSRSDEYITESISKFWK